MREFFKGWRRKIGCVALVMACAFLCGWVRSLYATDTVIRSVNHTTEGVFSTEGSFGWFKQDHPEIINRSAFWEASVGEFGTISDPTFVWSWNGFSSIESQSGRASSIPYWSIVIPLTLLSAYLIVWKPRQRTEPDHA